MTTSQCAHLQPHPLSVVRILLGSVVVSSSSHTHGTLAQVCAIHPTSIFMFTCAVSSPDDPSFLLLAPPSAPFPLPHLHEVYGKPAQLLQRGCGRLCRPRPLHKKNLPLLMIEHSNIVDFSSSTWNSKWIMASHVQQFVKSGLSDAGGGGRSKHEQTRGACKGFRDRLVQVANLG